MVAARRFPNLSPTFPQSRAQGVGRGKMVEVSL
jgi:hypothetical protein